jgi:hypothetical protein
MTLPKSLEKFRDKIDDVSDERASDNGYWVYLKCGWREPDGETHCVHEDTIGECAKLMKWITPCIEPGCCSPVATK